MSRCRPRSSCACCRPSTSSSSSARSRTSMKSTPTCVTSCSGRSTNSPRTADSRCWAERRFRIAVRRLSASSMSRRRHPLLHAVAELVNAANGLSPIAREGYITIPVFAFGWPTSELSLLYLAGSVLDAVRRGLRGDFRGMRGRIAFQLTTIAWGLLWLIHHRNAASQPSFEEPLREALGDDYETVAAQSQPARRRRRIGIPPNDLIRRRYVEKAGTVQYGPDPKINLA